MLTPEILRETWEAYADCSMDAKATARKLFISPTATSFRLDKIKATSGLDPRNFHDLAKLCGYKKTEGANT